MPGIRQACCDACPWDRLEHFSIVHWYKVIDHAGGIFNGIKRFDGRFAALGALLVDIDSVISWICPESRSMMSHRLTVARVAKIGPL